MAVYAWKKYSTVEKRDIKLIRSQDKINSEGDELYLYESYREDSGQFYGTGESNHYHTHRNYLDKGQTWYLLANDYNHNNYNVYGNPLTLGGLSYSGNNSQLFEYNHFNQDCKGPANYLVVLEVVETYMYSATFSVKIFKSVNNTVKNAFIAEVFSTSKSTYPDNGLSGDYWYEYVGKISDTKIKKIEEVDIMKTIIKIGGGVLSMLPQKLNSMGSFTTSNLGVA